MPAAALMLLILIITLAGGIYWAVTRPEGEEPSGQVQIPPPADDGGAPGA